VEVLKLKESEESVDFRVGSLFDDVEDPKRTESSRGDRELDLTFGRTLDELRQKVVSLYWPTTVVGVGMAATVTTPSRDTELLFEQLADQWEMDAELSSRSSDAVRHTAYQQIIGIGPSALPLLLARLRDNPGHWFWALAAIAREDPAEGTSSFDEAREVWLDWGRKRNLIA
jgi:hypothetical protein